MTATPPHPATRDASSYSGADPQIAIAKVTVDGTTSGDGLNILTGETIKWKYTVTNVGNVALSNVTVTDNKAGVTPAYVSGDTNDDGKLELTETWIYEATGTSITGDYSNTGTASGTYTDSAGHSRTDTATDTSSYFGAAPHLSLTKTAVPTTYSAALQVIQYTLVATNDGNVPLSNVSISDPKLGALNCTPAQPATLAIGETLTCTGSYTIKAADVNAGITGKVTNTATATGSYTDDAGHTGDATATATATVTQVAATGGIRPTGTTCQQFSTGTGQTMQQYYPPLGYVYYTVKNQKINNVNPGVFFYWSKIATAPSGSFVITVPQANLTNYNTTWPKIPTASGDNIVLWDSSCNKVGYTASYDPATGTATLTPTSWMAGSTYYLSVKWQPSSKYNASNNNGLVGYSTGSTKPLVTYLFQTYVNGALIPSSGATQILAAKK